MLSNSHTSLHGTLQAPDQGPRTWIWRTDSSISGFISWASPLLQILQKPSLLSSSSYAYSHPGGEWTHQWPSLGSRLHTYVLFPQQLSFMDILPNSHCAQHAEWTSSRDKISSPMWAVWVQMYVLPWPLGNDSPCWPRWPWGSWMTITALELWWSQALGVISCAGFVPSLTCLHAACAAHVPTPCLLCSHCPSSTSFVIPKPVLKLSCSAWPLPQPDGSHDQETLAVIATCHAFLFSCTKMSSYAQSLRLGGGGGLLHLWLPPHPWWVSSMGVSSMSAQATVMYQWWRTG